MYTMYFWVLFCHIALSPVSSSGLYPLQRPPSPSLAMASINFIITANMQLHALLQQKLSYVSEMF